MKNAKELVIFLKRKKFESIFVPDSFEWWSTSIHVEVDYHSKTNGRNGQP